MTAPAYVTCACGGRAPVDERDPSDEMECELCGHIWYEDAGAVLTRAGYVNDANHGWVDPTDTSWWLDCNPCYYGWSHTEGPPERRGRWE